MSANYFIKTKYDEFTITGGTTDIRNFKSVFLDLESYIIFNDKVTVLELEHIISKFKIRIKNKIREEIDPRFHKQSIVSLEIKHFDKTRIKDGTSIFFNLSIFIYIKEFKLVKYNDPLIHSYFLNFTKEIVNKILLEENELYYFKR